MPEPPPGRIHCPVVILTRSVRFAVNPGLDRPDGRNGFAGRPPLAGLGRHYQLDVCCKGHLDATSGYLLDIQAIDRAAREAVLPAIEAACDEHPQSGAGEVLLRAMPAAGAALGGRLDSLRWHLSPFHSVEVQMRSPSTVLLRQRFDFAAAHRLHVPSLSDDENRRLFGKCNLPGGHGHNYRLEPCVAVPAGAGGPPPLSLADLEAVVMATVVDRFDHRNLNHDVEEFRQPGGLNPTVENIAKVCYDLLGPAIRARSPGADLRSVTVWETDRTSSTYPA
jgi:6-pyruvoyltetrahydropterin/6-carboxytetrahydropterin synthase